MNPIIAIYLLGVLAIGWYLAKILNAAPYPGRPPVDPTTKRYGPPVILLIAALWPLWLILVALAAVLEL